MSRAPQRADDRDYPAPPAREMELRIRGPSDGRVVAALNEHGIVYDRPRYSGLVSTASVLISASAAKRLRADIDATWEWMRTWQDLYSGLVTAGETMHRIVRAAEWGLPPHVVRLQRQVAQRGDQPTVGRIDSIVLDPTQQIAEVQWKGGGEGFNAGIDALSRRLFPLERGEHPLGDLVAGWAAYFRAWADGNSPAVVNCSRATWAPSERFFAKRLAEHDVEMVFIPRPQLGEQITVRDGQVFCTFPSGLRRVDFLHVDRLGQALPGALLEQVVDAALSGSVRVEPPPSFLYNQKAGFALPFCQEYQDRFSDEARAIFPPTALIDDRPPECEALAQAIDHPESERLSECRAWEDILSLPRSLRERLIVKCASTHGRMNTAGRGVWQLGGSASVARRTLDAVLTRTREQGEPWILQSYVDRTWSLPLEHPEMPRVDVCDAHARFAIYCSKLGSDSTILGGVASFSPFWKVGGKDAFVDDRGRLGGAAFVDIRLLEDVETVEH